MPPIRRRFPPHPSGRPIRRTEQRKLPIARITEKGSLTPRLKDDEKDLSLVGFHHAGLGDFDDDNEDE